MEILDNRTGFRTRFSGIGPKHRSNSDEGTLLGEASFKRAINLEIKRTKRAGNSALLLLLDFGKGEENVGNSEQLIGTSASALLSVIRETDLTGWYSPGKVVGTLFTELPPAPGLKKSVAAIETRVAAALQSALVGTNAVIRISAQLLSVAQASKAVSSSQSHLIHEAIDSRKSA